MHRHACAPLGPEPTVICFVAPLDMPLHFQFDLTRPATELVVFTALLVPVVGLVVTLLAE